jgi:hypothetical protein
MRFTATITGVETVRMANYDAEPEPPAVRGHDSVE